MDLFRVSSLPFLTRRSYSFEIRHLLLWSVLAGLIEGGSFASVVVAHSFHGSDMLIAVTTTTPVAALLFSLIWGMLCVGRPKIMLMTVFCGATVLCGGLVGLIPRTQTGAVWFVAQIAAAQVCLAGVVTVRSAIWKSNYPKRARGRIAARLQAARFSVAILIALLAGAWCERDPGKYALIYPAAAIVGAISIVGLRRIRIRGERRELGRRQRDTGDGDDLRAGMVEPFTMTALLSPGHVLGQMTRVLRDDRRFRRYCVAQFLLGMANLMSIPIAIVLIVRRLDLGDDWSFWTCTVLVVALRQLLLVGTVGRWGRLFDRVGVVRFRVVNCCCWLVAMLLGLCANMIVDTDSATPLALPISVALFALWAGVQGLGRAGGALAWNLGHLHFAHHKDAEIYMGIHVSLTGVRGLIMPIVGIWLWGRIGWGAWLVAIALTLASMALFARMARDERATEAPGRGVADSE